jgi:hypothetical protein
MDVVGDKAETFLFSLYALPKKLPVKPGFDPLALRESTLEVSGDVGILATSYER